VAISEKRPRARAAVAWLGDLPPTDVLELFVARGFVTYPCNDANLQDPTFLAGLAVVIFTQDPAHPRRVAMQIEAHVETILDFDCQVIVRVASAAVIPGQEGTTSFLPLVAKVVQRLKFPNAGIAILDPALVSGSPKAGVPPRPYVHIIDLALSWPAIANGIASDIPGAPPKYAGLTITSDSELSPTHDLLMRRAFADCSEIHLSTMAGGRSGVDVYRAYADLSDGTLGPWPLPYFIKIGQRSKIFKEYQNYKEVVDPYVPFHLGPHLIEERCHLGAKEGILVGDYVENSESLNTTAKDGRAAQAIACLFNTTLNGWYRSAVEESTPLTQTLLFPDLSKLAHRAVGAKALGATTTPEQLAEVFGRCATAIPVLMGFGHGDLHTANILVRAADAIVIDFLAHKYMPLVYDVACLEASLLVDGFFQDERAIPVWLKSVACLYNGAILDRKGESTHPKDPSAWFFGCAAQIRLYARQLERKKGQYAAALAIALLFKAAKDGQLPELENSRRAAAYYLAEKLLLGMFDQQYRHRCKAGQNTHLIS
jgi:Phosphotransferase enzyme family